MTQTITADSRKSWKVENVIGKQYAITHNELTILIEEENLRELIWEGIRFCHDLLDDEAKDKISELEHQIELLKKRG